ncbi:pirin family protein [Archangium gephyra]|uniref:pirin family protein n=1 Tax=Archangium gephyra TaxID=48 RepID=UPI003B7F41E5
MSTRSVLKVVEAVRTLEGEGFVVRRPFPIPGFMQFDPFLLLDELGPVDLPPGEAKGAPDHPHRGFETVSYILEGRHEHADSAGHAGQLGPGDVQWMTAGAGVVHSEMPAREFSRTGGRMHGFQVWVNLPRRDKMMPPRYQELPLRAHPGGLDAGRPGAGEGDCRRVARRAGGHRHAHADSIPALHARTGRPLRAAGAEGSQRLRLRVRR